LTTARSARWFAFWEGEAKFWQISFARFAAGIADAEFEDQRLKSGAALMQFVSATEKATMEKKREELYKMQLDVQERIRKAASLGDLSENAEYHFAKEENRSIQRELAELELKLRNVSVVSNDDVPANMVFIGHTVKLLDLDDDSEQLVRIVGEAQSPDPNSDVLPVSANSPMGDALMKARVGDTVKVRAPRGTMEFKILEILE
jgi:transcription elongation factor GreA